MGYDETEAKHGYGEPVSAVAVTPDGGRAVSASWDGTVRVWDLATGRTLRALHEHTNLVRAVAVTPDGYRAVSASEDGTLRIWDLEKGDALAMASLDGKATCLILTAVGTALVVGDDAGSIYCLQFADRKGSTAVRA
jgi:WD40 repeat protein